MKKGKLQAKDIPDRPVLEFLAQHPDKWHMRWDVGVAMPPGTPPKLQLAKMRSLMGRGLVGGCGCGCRGDFAITEKGFEYLGLDWSNVKFNYY